MKAPVQWDFMAKNVCTNATATITALVTLKQVNAFAVEDGLADIVMVSKNNFIVCNVNKFTLNINREMPYWILWPRLQRKVSR